MRTVALSLLVGLLAATLALAQAPKTSKPVKYDVKAEVTLTGIVEDLHESKQASDHPGLHVLLKTDTESVEVHTCPLRFLKDLEFGIDKGETLTIIGSRPGGGGIVLARELRKEQTSLAIRDKTGAPVWTR